MKKISVDNLKPGMYLSKICGSWFAHPFWKKEFILDVNDIELLKQSSILEVIVDSKKGVWPAQPITHTQIDISSEESEKKQNIELSEKNKKNNIQQESIKPSSFIEESQKAKRIISISGKKVQSLLNEARMGNSLSEEIAQEIVDEISNSVFRNTDALISIARLKTKDDYTYMHSVSVCALMVALAKALGYEYEFCKKAGMAGLYHDIGKMFIPLEALNKPGKLTDEEFEIVKSHPVKGWEFLKNFKGISPETLDVCLHHHEKIDGTGYPEGLKSDEISVLAKMAAICDVYDAITSNRPYKSGWEPSDSIRKMAEWMNHFDRQIFYAFVKVIGIYPVGSLVKLSNGKIGVVIDKCEKNLLKPKIKTFYSSKTQSMIMPEIIDLSGPGVAETIVSYENPSKYNFGNLASLWQS